VSGFTEMVTRAERLLIEANTQIHRLNNELTKVTLERDALKKTLNPTESVVLTVALSQVLRGDEVPPNTTAVCVLALARVAGKYDWTAPSDIPTGTAP
jgi:hypothetical protein